MLKSVLSFVAIVSIITLMSCGGSKAPSDTVNSFIEGIENADYEGAIDLLDLGDEEMDEDSKKKLTAMFEMGTKQIEEKGGIQSWEVIKEEIEEDGESAFVEVLFIYENGEENKSPYQLNKVDGNWMIAFK